MNADEPGVAGAGRARQLLGMRLIVGAAFWSADDGADAPSGVSLFSAVFGQVSPSLAQVFVSRTGPPAAFSTVSHYFAFATVALDRFFC
jgi:hypothetical protein